MSTARLKYLRNEVVEDLTARRIREYEAKAGVTVQLPVPIEKIVEQQGHARRPSLPPLQEDNGWTGRP